MTDTTQNEAPAVVDRGDEIVAAAPVVAAPEVPENPMGEKPAAAAEPAAEPAAAAEPEVDDKPRDTKGKFVPKDRFDAIAEARRAEREQAAARIKELEAQLATVNTSAPTAELQTQIDTLDEKLEAARLDGDKELAVKLARELRTLERQIAAAESTTLTASAKEQALAELRFDITVEKLEAAYPEIDPNHEKYDQKIVDEIVARRDANIKLGQSPATALEGATREYMTQLADQHELEELRRMRDEGTLGKGVAAPAAAPAASGRTVEAVKKAVDAANAQPPSTATVGLDSDRAGAGKDGLPDPNKLSAMDLEKLPASTLARMRGDEVFA